MFKKILDYVIKHKKAFITIGVSILLIIVILLLRKKIEYILAILFCGGMLGLGSWIKEDVGKIKSNISTREEKEIVLEKKLDAINKGISKIEKNISGTKSTCTKSKSKSK